ncbi:MAG TPA: hypothetical protein VEF05_09240 [Terriglobales bacterium]|nr:hypothetical protein [Terriglobales bacterium]
MKKWLALAALAVSCSLAACSHPRPVPPPPPPPEYPAVAREGFHDGWEAARRDVARGGPLPIERHPRFANPPVPPEAAEDYRRGFRRGYNVYLNREAPPPPP